MSSQSCWSHYVAPQMNDSLQKPLIYFVKMMGHDISNNYPYYFLIIGFYWPLRLPKSTLMCSVFQYLTKQTVALREVNDSRLRIYEQLEVSIQDLERANHRLVLDNSAEKKHIKSLNTTIESLEAKCEELQSTTDDLRLQVDVLRRRSQRNSDVQVSTVSSRETVTLRPVDRRYDEEKGLVSPVSSASPTDEVSRTIVALSVLSLI